MIRLTIEVADIATVILVYNQIHIYTSDSETGTYTLLASVSLHAGVSTYYYTDIAGTSDTWYRSTYYNSVTLVESGMSNAVQGTAPSLFHTVTYPDEYEFTDSEQVIIRKIRRYIGDFVELKRIYSEGDVFCTSIMDDNHTIDMGQKGWPVYVSVASIEYTSLDDPIVQGYRYLTFSGTLTSGTTNPLINIWFYAFKFSDLEIYEAYGDAMIPPMVPSSCVTQDHLMLQAAIDLLENMTAADLVDDGATIRDDQTMYDPAAGLRERGNLINRLRKQLDALIKECITNSMLGITGILID
jgi:hypothetical protein